MKLLVLFIVLACWFIKPLRAKLDHLPMWTSGYFQLTENLLSKYSWYQQKNGPWIIAIFAAFILQFFTDSLNQSFLLDIINLVFQAYLLLSIILCLHKQALVSIMPNIIPETISLNTLNNLPANVWQSAYIWVTPIFWYGIFGVFGLIFYGIIALLQNNFRGIWVDYARMMTEMLAWLPARILALAYIIVGPFMKIFKIWQDYAATGMIYNQFILKRCFWAALDNGCNIYRIQRDAMVLLLGVYAVLVIISWAI